MRSTQASTSVLDAQRGAVLLANGPVWSVAPLWRGLGVNDRVLQVYAAGSRVAPIAGLERQTSLLYLEATPVQRTAASRASNAWFDMQILIRQGQLRAISGVARGDSSLQGDDMG